MNADSNGGAYVPAGEDQGRNAAFSAQDLAAALGVDVERVHRAVEG